MIRGLLTDMLWIRGPGGTHTRESGLGARTSRSGSATESAFSAVMDGAGIIGDSIGVVGTQCITTTDTSPGATHFITEAISIEERTDAADSTKTAAELTLGAAGLITVRVRQTGPSTETLRLLGDLQNRAGRAGSDLGRSVDTAKVDRPEATRHEGAPALAAEVFTAVVEEDFTEAVVEHVGAVGADAGD